MRSLAPLLCCSLLWISCSSNSSNKHKPIQTTHCKYWLQTCHQNARARCPSGYTVTRSVRLDKVGGPQGAYKSFKMLFTCN